MVCGPEVVRMVREFEDASVLSKEDPIQFRHQRVTPAFQKRFKEHYKKFMDVFEKLGNPFLCKDDNTDLLQLDTKDIMDPGIVKTVNDIEELGVLQLKEFVSERLENKTKTIDAQSKRTWCHCPQMQIRHHLRKEQVEQKRKTSKKMLRCLLNFTLQHKCEAETFKTFSTMKQ